MKKPSPPKQTYTVTDVNAILHVAEAVREIRREHPEHNKMKVFNVVDGVFLSVQVRYPSFISRVEVLLFRFAGT